MGNAKTEHSLNLKRQAARDFQKKLTAENRFEIRSKDASKIQSLKQGLAEISANSACGNNNADKILYLIDFWKTYHHNSS